MTWRLIEDFANNIVDTNFDFDIEFGTKMDLLASSFSNAKTFKMAVELHTATLSKKRGNGPNTYPSQFTFV